MTKRQLLPFATSLFFLTALCERSAADDQPNVVIIYFDDTGWTDFGCFGGAVDTPHIDQLASEGMRFTEYYAPAPNCSPSRAGLMTGRFPFRVGMYSYLGVGSVMHLPESEVTIAEALKNKGYATGVFGPPQTRPDRRPGKKSLNKQIPISSDVKPERNWRALILLLIALAIAAPVAGLLTAPRFQALMPTLASKVRAVESGVQDHLVRRLPSLEPLDQIVFLGIDESSLRAYELPANEVDVKPLSLMSEPWPWSREVWALAIEKLIESGAQLVVVDILFSSPGEGDDALRAVIEAHPDKVVLAGGFLKAEGVQEPGERPAYGKLAMPSKTVIPAGSPAEGSVGYGNLWPDSDGKIRQVSYQVSAADAGPVELRSFAAVVLGQMGADDRIPGPPATRLMRFVADLAAAYPVLPFYEVFWPTLWDGKYQSGEFFRDKIVMIGPTSPDFYDTLPTPVGNTLGAHLHLNAMTAAIRGGFYQRTGNWANAILIFAAAFLATLFVGAMRRQRAAFLGLFGGGAIFLVGAWLVLLNFDQLIGVAGPLASWFGVGVVGLSYNFGCRIHAAASKISREREVMHKALQQRVSKDVLQEILDNPEGYINQLGGVRKDVTVLFSDLRGFTSLSESVDPDTLVHQLNQYFDIMVGLIEGDRGMVDKFIGDAIMAVWGSVPSLDECEGSPMAVAAALRMSRALPKLNVQWQENGSPQLAMGIGVHRGEAVTGNVGSEKRLELTVIGDTVNLASRLEGVTKMYRVEIVISETVAGDLAEGWIVRPLDRVQVMGRSAPVGIFEPLAMPGDGDDLLEAATLLAESYTSAFSLYQSREFQKAAKAFEAILVKFPQDLPANLLAERCRGFCSRPPPQEWTGSVPLESK